MKFELTVAAILESSFRKCFVGALLDRDCEYGNFVWSSPLGTSQSNSPDGHGELLIVTYKFQHFGWLFRLVEMSLMQMNFFSFSACVF